MRLILSTFLLLLLFSCSPKEEPQPAPKANFLWASAGEGSVQFTDQSSDADSYAWSFGDNEPINTEKNPKHFYGQNGQYIVTLSIKNSTSTDRITKLIDVNSFSAPVAKFSVTMGDDGQVIFNNSSTNALSYAWDLGNGTTSQQASPSVKYLENKKYTISLTAQGKGGQAKVSQDVEIVNIKPSVNFTWTQSNGQVTFTNTSVNADSYLWDFGNGKTSTDANPTTRYLKTGNYPVKLVAKGKAGETTKISSITIGTVVLTLSDVVDDQYLTTYLPGTWGVYVKGENMKFNNYTYRFSASSNGLNYKNYYNNYFTLSSPETTRLYYTLAVKDKVIYTDGVGGKQEKYARFEIVSDDEMRFFRIIETATSCTELTPLVLTRTSDVEKSINDVVKSSTLANTLKGVWDQGSYSIYTDVYFDFSAGKNYYVYNTTFQGARSNQKTEFKVDANNILSYRFWNSDFDPSWKKYKVEVISDRVVKLYSITSTGQVSSQPEYTLQKRN